MSPRPARRRAASGGISTVAGEKRREKEEKDARMGPMEDTEGCYERPKSVLRNERADSPRHGRRNYPICHTHRHVRRKKHSQGS